MTDASNVTGQGDFTFHPSVPSWVRAGSANPTAKGFSELLGYEADRIYNLASFADRTWSLIAESDFVGGQTTTDSHSVFYTMNNSGARVFAAGTIQWSWGIDSFGGDVKVGPGLHPNLYDPDAEVVTENILICLRDGGTACGS